MEDQLLNMKFLIRNSTKLLIHEMNLCYLKTNQSSFSSHLTKKLNSKILRISQITKQQRKAQAKISHLKNLKNQVGKRERDN